MKRLFALPMLLSACGFNIPLENAAIDARDIDAPPTIDGSIDIDAPAIDAAPPIDAAPDAMLMWVDVETITVPCNGGERASQTSLANGVMYRLRASGECIANTQNNSRADAEYIGYNLAATSPIDVYMNVDTGIAVNDTTPGPTKQPRWGTFANGHTYEVMWTGLGSPITVKYHEEDVGNNSGNLSLTIQAFQ